MKRSQQTASDSPRPADVTTSGDQERAAELPRLDDQPIEFDRVAQRAYERYEARGRQDGGDMDDWLEAERELRQSASPGDTRGRASDGAAARIKQ
jgi:hypothetical protein